MTGELVPEQWPSGSFEPTLSQEQFAGCFSITPALYQVVTGQIPEIWGEYSSHDRRAFVRSCVASRDKIHRPVDEYWRGPKRYIESADVVVPARLTTLAVERSDCGPSGCQVELVVTDRCGNCVLSDTEPSLNCCGVETPLDGPVGDGYGCQFVLGQPVHSSVGGREAVALTVVAIESAESLTSGRVVERKFAVVADDDPLGGRTRTDTL